MTFYCPECLENWYASQAHLGVCPDCGTGTRMVQEPAGREAVRRWLGAVAGTQPTEPVDSLELWWLLPSAEDGPRAA